MTGPAVAGLEGRLGFALTVPESWFEIDVDPATRDDSIRRLVEDRVRGNDAMWKARHGVTRILRQEARKAWESGAAYAACMVHATDEGPITASVVISLVRGPVGATAEGDPSSFMAERLVSVPRKPDDDLFTAVTTVEIPEVGHCARSYGVEDVQVDSGFIRTAFMQTFVPVPGANKVFIVSASSPVVALAAELHDLFDAVTGTFRLVDLGEVRRGAAG
jgi:hypothetical protein